MTRLLIGGGLAPSTTMSKPRKSPKPAPVSVVVASEEEHTCSVCGGECFILGGLGNLTHFRFRCRNCGMTSYTKVG